MVKIAWVIFFGLILAVIAFIIAPLVSYGIALWRREEMTPFIRANVGYSAVTIGVISALIFFFSLLINPHELLAGGLTVGVILAGVGLKLVGTARV